MNEPAKRKVISLTKPDAYTAAEPEDLNEKEEFRPRTAQPVYKDTPFVPEEKYLTGQNNTPQYIRPADTYRQNRNINTDELFNLMIPPHKEKQNPKLTLNSNNFNSSRPSLIPFMLCVIIVIFLIFTIEFAYDFPFLIYFIPVLMVALRLIIETKIK